MTAKAGETLTLTGVFRNQSEHDVYIEFPDYKCQGLDYDSATLADLFSIYLLPKGESAENPSISVTPRLRKTIAQGETVIFSQEIQVPERGTYDAFAEFSFYAGDALDAADEYTEYIAVITDRITINAE